MKEGKGGEGEVEELVMLFRVRRKEEEKQLEKGMKGLRGGVRGDRKWMRKVRKNMGKKEKGKDKMGKRKMEATWKGEN